MSNVCELSERNFRKEVLESVVPTLVDFWAPWCVPCRTIGSVVDELATKKADAIKVGKVNIDTNHDLAAAYGVYSIPTLLLFRNGEIVDRFIGVCSRVELEHAFELVVS